MSALYKSKKTRQINEQTEAAKLIERLPFMNIPKKFPHGKVCRHAQKM